MGKDDLRALAERVMGLAGPCEKTDAAILYDVLGVMQNHKGPAFTASLDAAMTLVPKGWKLRQMHFSAPCADDRKWHLNLYGGREGVDAFVGRGATPALALTAAALLAHAEQVPE